MCCPDLCLNDLSDVWWGREPSASLEVTQNWEEWLMDVLIHGHLNSLEKWVGRSHTNFNKKCKVLPLWSNSSRHKKVLGANQLANSLAEILPWLLHIPPGVPSSPSKGSRWYLPASSSDCLDLCRSPWRDVKTVISRSWHEVSCAVKGTQASAQGVQMETNRTCAWSDSPPSGLTLYLQVYFNPLRDGIRDMHHFFHDVCLGQWNHNKVFNIRKRTN